MHFAEFLRPTAAKLLSVNSRDERNRRLAIALLSAAGAAVVWYVFHGVYSNLTFSANAVGYVEPMTQAGIDFGYAVMIGGTLILAAIAAWSAFQYLRLLIGRDR
jgi:hypothetical protein